MKKIAHIAASLAAAVSIAAPVYTGQAAPKNHSTEIQANQTSKKAVQINQNTVSQYTAPQRFLEGRGNGKRRPWSRGPMSLHKQKMQHKKYAKSKK